MSPIFKVNEKRDRGHQKHLLPASQACWTHWAHINYLRKSYHNNTEIALKEVSTSFFPIFRSASKNWEVHNRLKQGPINVNFTPAHKAENTKHKLNKRITATRCCNKDIMRAHTCTEEPFWGSFSPCGWLTFQHVQTDMQSFTKLTALRLQR